MIPTQQQKTILREASLRGIGLFTGEKTSIRLCPAPADSGIIFRRVDLPGKPQLPANLSYVKHALRCTRLASADASIQMVEHLLSAISAYEIDNLSIEVEGPEIPAADGSSSIFVDLLEDAGIKPLDSMRKFLQIEQPFSWSSGEVHLVAIPANEFQISYTLYYPQSPYLGSQYFSLKITPENYKKEISRCRTFSLFEEIAPFVEKGFIKGGGLDNAVVIKDNQVMNSDGVRFSDEMVRHKILDLIGDLALLGQPLLAHVMAVRSGHASNIAFAKELKECAVRATGSAPAGCVEDSKWQESC